MNQLKRVQRRNKKHPMTSQPHVRCYTRALKNAKYLREAAPDVFGKDPNAEGFGTGLPLEILSALHGIRDDSPELRVYKEVADVVRINPPPTPSAAVRGALFDGTIHFAQVTFRTSGGDVVFPTADMNQIVRYAQRVLVPITEYATQYGPNPTVSVSPTLLTYTADVPTSSYTETDLTAWVNDIARSNGLPGNSAIFVISPQGIDASAAGIGGNGGFHWKASIPYMVIGVFASGLTVEDQADVFAMGVSHEIAEMIVDPDVDPLSNPEVCDPCDVNCQNLTRCYFDASNHFLGSNQNSPPGGFSFSYYICAIAKPAGAAGMCLATAADCQYAPSSTGPTTNGSLISMRQYLVCKNIDPATGLRSHFSSADLARGLRSLVVSEPPAINAFIVAPSQISSGGSVTIEWRVRSCCPPPLLKIRITQKNFHTKEVLAVHNGLAANGTLMDSPQVDSIYYLDASCEGGAAASPFERSVAVTGTLPNWQPFCFKVVNPDDSDFCRTGTWWAATQSDAEDMVRREYPPHQGYVHQLIDCSEIATACGG